MRSSIACIRCRRSKVKCINNGVGSTCRSCVSSGRECTYPSAVPGGGSRKRESSFSAPVFGNADADRDGERRQRQKKSVQTFAAHSQSGVRNGLRPTVDALDPRILTPTVWQELFDIFQIHYSADLPFLHKSTFLRPLQQPSVKPPALHPSTAAPTASGTARPPASDGFLLAFLALTARFHPRLVAHHSPPSASRPSNPLIAAEYYASAANAQLASKWTEHPTYDIEQTQTTLLLGLHEWGVCRGAKAWLMVGFAIRAAQAMGLQYEMDLDDEPLSRNLTLGGEGERMGLTSSRKNPQEEGKTEEHLFIEQEIRRRTFWSCFIMDRYLSSGKYRPQMLHARELRIQLPASERSFLFGVKVQTLMLGEEDESVAGRAEVQSHRQATVMLGTGGTPERTLASSPQILAEREDGQEKGGLETGADEGLVSRYIKILEIYGNVVKWSCAGGRRREEHPPWDDRCEWYKLRRSCLEFKAGLPRLHRLSPQNTQAHISDHTSTPYTLVHTVYLLCQIMLHREYVPFIPIRCPKPEGPLDPPLFPADKYPPPPSFWENSARECFKSAREIMDLVRTCQEWNALVETPIVGFAIYTVAFVGVYCMNFPWMDPECYMCTQQPCVAAATRPSPGGIGTGESKGAQAARKALEMIAEMRPRLHMADGWYKTIIRMHRYIKRMKSDCRKNVAVLKSGSDGNSPMSSRHLSLREGGEGGGLVDYVLFERTLKEFGKLEDQGVDMTEALERSEPHAMYDESSAGSTINSEEAENLRAPSRDQSRRESGPWNAINDVSGASQARPASASSPAVPATNGQFRSYEGYSQQPTPTSRAPQQHPSQQQPGYAQPPNGFRPAYSPHEGHPLIPAGTLPSLTSPGSHTASASSHPSPSFHPQQQHQRDGPLAPQHAPHGYDTMQPPQLPQQSTYVNGNNPQQLRHSHAATPVHSFPPYIPLGAPHHIQAQQYPEASPLLRFPAHQQQQAWTSSAKEDWLDNVPPRMGGDDLAAFTQGGEVGDFAARGCGAPDPGWLHLVWA